MIEVLSKLAEVGQKTLAKSKFDPDAKIAKREVTSANETKSSDKPYNPDDKVEYNPDDKVEKGAEAEVGQKLQDIAKSKFDPDAKIAKREVTSANETKSSDKPYNPDDKVEKQENSHEVNEAKEKKGGSYKEMKDAGYGDYSEPPQEVHHMPADSSSELPRDDGPAITMDKEDHRKTASCGSTKEAKEYRAKQKELIEQGKFREALQMDIDDIHEKFGDKYDEGIKDMLDYVDKLEEAGRV